VLSGTVRREYTTEMKIGRSITVVIPVHDGVRYLAAAIDSVLTQTTPAGEIVVVDDGSGDGSARIASAYGAPVVCLKRDHRGPAAARNTGVAAGAGEWIAFLDADDLWMPEKLALQTEATQVDPGIDVVTGGWENFLSPDIEPDPGSPQRFPTGVQTAPLASSMLVKRSSFHRAGGFDETLACGEVIDWLLRARHNHLRFKHVPELVSRRRVHAGNYTRGHAVRNQAYLGLVRKHLSTRHPAPERSA
jgi:glycosyltransferase involved in cell wall biosynthesis